MHFTVQNCSRCGGNHESVEFKEFTKPVVFLNGPTETHWAMCPTLQEPILGRMVNVLAPADETAPTEALAEKDLEGQFEEMEVVQKRLTEGVVNFILVEEANGRNTEE